MTTPSLPQPLKVALQGRKVPFCRRLTSNGVLSGVKRWLRFRRSRLAKPKKQFLPEGFWSGLAGDAGERCPKCAVLRFVVIAK